MANKHDEDKIKRVCGLWHDRGEWEGNERCCIEVRCKKKMPPAL